MYINMKKIYRYSVLMMIGLSLIFYGIIQGTIQDRAQVPPTDQEVIERAEELGMIFMSDYYLEKLKENE